ncbi:MAG: 4-(cytidine 5'-diphospho)-2-C-methyl-D-erythritol kinase [Desulfovibrionaceae bacterium]|nr:4-(cytidine 5'-diphospho)-2-C-methyl-D-erythritol kinase [Desulfovibrionaceae bacterium]
MVKNWTRPTLLKSGCKINLFLEITGRRTDGYHSLNSWIMPLDEPHDEITIQTGNNAGASCQVSCRETGLDPLDNTLTKAYALFEQNVAPLPPLRIELRKGVPIGAGLGGGSANAGCFLLFCNSLSRKLGQKALEGDELLKLAAGVGADVPFFIMNTPARVSGMGEKLAPDLSPLLPLEGMILLLVCPELRISTAWAYAAWDKMQNNPPCGLTIDPSRYRNKPALNCSLYNSLEKPVFAEYPQLAAIKNELLEAGAEFALMSGSGSSIFGIFADQDAAATANTAFTRMGLRTYMRLLRTGASPSW